jgi:L-lactate utilization protein LutB
MKWAELADEDTVKRTSDALRARGVRVEFLQTRQKALKRIVELIPPGAEVMTGSSTTLKEIGFVELLWAASIFGTTSKTQ